ncbi:glycosyl hydrolase family 18 protein [Sanguibacter sp. A247]|uniref:glycosyl hydrolase family 18 protein n=1 Tax=unclassified Sanguibacter TaxID=2645534 RepID=UPI003FD844C4
MRTSTQRRLAALGATLAFALAGITAGAVGAGSATAASTPAPQPAAADADATAPHQWLTGYWHNFDNGSTTMRLTEIPAAYNLVAVAFADADPTRTGAITFTLASAELNGYTTAEFTSDIARLHAEGRKVILSIGGEKGNVTVNSPAAASALASSAYALMQEYGFDGVDIDLEHGIDADNLTRAMRELRALAGPSLIIGMAPQTIDYQATTMGYYRLTKNIADILTIVNVQYYNSGSMMGCNQTVYAQGSVDFLTSLSCILLEMGLRPDQVGIGVPAVPRAAGGGYQPLANVVAAVDCLEKGTSCGSFVPERPYGPIGGVMTWSVNWDATNGYALATTLGNRLHTDGTPTAPPSTDPPTTTPPATDPPTTEPPTTEPPTAEPPTAEPPTTEPPTSCGTVAAWDATTVYTGGARAALHGTVYEARWWTQGQQPGTADSPWRTVGPCDFSTEPTTTPTPTLPPAGECPAPWNASTVYVSGATVLVGETVWTARWWTQGDTPGASQWGPWTAGASCS